MTIILDAGHGGSDPGAVGPCGVREKDVVLAVAQLLHERLPGSILTRSDDTFVTLSNRARFANDANADLFISIHANSHTSKAEGIETYHHASSKEGNRLARLIQSAMTEQFPDHKDRGVKDANYYVLKHTAMPAVLVELEFVSSRWCDWLSREDVQKQYADAIARGVRAYLGQPQGTDETIWAVTVDDQPVGAWRRHSFITAAVNIALADKATKKIVVERT